MWNFVSISCLLLALSQTAIQSPVQDASRNENRAEARTNAVPQDKTPITALTTMTTAQPLYPRREIPERDIHTTPDHSFPSPTKTRPLPTSTPSPTTSTSTAVPTKSLKNCNVEGIPTDLLVSNILDMRYAYDAMACQLRCMYISRCEAYSWQMPVSTDSNNCVFYSTLIDGTRKVTASNVSGIFFSDKYPADKSNFCYGSETL